MTIRFTITGTVRQAENGIGVPGLFVKAYDKGLLFDDLLGTAITGTDGSFEIVSEASDFREFFERRPDLYLRVFRSDRKTEIWSSKEAVRWRAGRYETFDVRIPRDVLATEAVHPSISFVDHAGQPQPAHQPGDALVLRASGLRPSAPHTIELRDDNGTIVIQTVSADANGAIRDAVIWPQIGLDDPRDRERLPVEEVSQRWHGRTIAAVLRDGERIVSESNIKVSEAVRPVAVATDANGLLLNGFEVGESDAVLTLLGFGEWNSARIWMVPRQHEWHDGDPIMPVRLSREKVARADTLLKNNAHRVIVAKRKDLQPGAYDFVIRRLRYGYEDDDDFFVRPSDIVTSRRSTGLVVREKFMASKIIRGGCTNLQQIAARRTLGNISPYVQFTETIRVGEDVR